MDVNSNKRITHLTQYTGKYYPKPPYPNGNL